MFLPCAGHVCPVLLAQLCLPSSVRLVLCAWCVCLRVACALVKALAEGWLPVVSSQGLWESLHAQICSPSHRTEPKPNSRIRDMPRRLISQGLRHPYHLKLQPGPRCHGLAQCDHLLMQPPGGERSLSRETILSPSIAGQGTLPLHQGSLGWTLHMEMGCKHRGESGT